MAGRAKEAKTLLNELDPSGDSWKGFQVSRDALKAQGWSVASANTQALAEWLPIAQAKADTRKAAGSRPTETTADAPTPPTDAPSLPPASGLADKMLPAEAFKDGDEYAHPVEVLKWVTANILRSDPDPATAPDSTAWAVLWWVRSNQANMTAFFTGMWSKLLPTRAQNEERGGFTADDGVLDDTLNWVQTAKRDAVLSASAEGPHGEPGVSEENQGGDGEGPAEAEAALRDVRE